MKGTWEDPAIVGDPRIDHESELVRRVAEHLHGNESMHMHEHVGASVCVYCALRASRALRWAHEIQAGREPTSDTLWGLVRLAPRPPAMLEDLTWTCHVCKDERPDHLIAVHTHHHGNGRCGCHPGRVELDENVRYCRDRPACAEGSKTYHHIKIPETTP